MSFGTRQVFTGIVSAARSPRKKCTDYIKFPALVNHAGIHVVTAWTSTEDMESRKVFPGLVTKSPRRLNLQCTALTCGIYRYGGAGECVYLSGL